MGRIGDLNVRVGVDSSDMLKGMRKAAQAMQREARNLSQIGNELSMNISAPLALIGIGAIKAAGDLESLQLALTTTMQDAGRSAEDARKEIEALRKAAQAPGLDFEQAVKGSVRLQNVGYKAEEAREILVQLANAVAMGGGSAQELDSVTRQFAQMISKGRVLQEDVTILMENMPGLAKAMEQAFGTKSVERIREMGISAEDFVKGVTKQLGTLPRVEGGIKNALVNAQVAIKTFGAQMGMEMAKAIDLQKTMEKMAVVLQAVANWFSGLSDSTKGWIVKVTIAIAAVGPMVKIYSVLALTVAHVRTAFVAAQGAVIGLRTALLAAAMKATPVPFANVGGSISMMGQAAAQAGANVRKMSVAFIGSVTAIVAVVGVLAYGLYSLYQEYNRLSAAQEAVQENHVQAANAISGEKTRAELLVGVLKDQNAKREDQIKALEELKRISPKHFSNLDIEKSKVEDINKALQSYVDGLLRAARAQSAIAQIQKLDEELNNLVETSDPSTFQQIGNFLLSGGNAAAFFSNNAQTLGDNIQAAKQRIEEKKKALEDVIKANVNVVDAVTQHSNAEGRAAAVTDKATAATESKTKALDEQRKEYERIRNLLTAPVDQLTQEPTGPQTLPQTNPLGVSADAAGVSAGTIEAATAGIYYNLNQISTGATAAQSALIGLWGTAQQMPSVFETMTTALQNVGMQYGGLAQVAASAGLALSQSASQGAMSMAELGKAALGAAAKVIRAQIMEGVAVAAAKALKSVPFPFNIAAAAAAGGAAAALFNRVLGAVGIPALAEGGLATAPTLAMVGDNPGARVDPEVIAPLSKLENMMGGGVQRIEITGTSRIDGRDLLITLKRAMRDDNRVF